MKDRERHTRVPGTSRHVAFAGAQHGDAIAAAPYDGEHLEACRLLSLPVQCDERGWLVYMESPAHIPFPVQRVFAIYGVPSGATRADHANRRLHEVLIPLHGSVRVVLRSPVSSRSFHLTRPDQGLHVYPVTWLTLSDFSAGAVVLVLASLPYSEDDHVRDFGEFCKLYRRIREHDGD